MPCVFGHDSADFRVHAYRTDDFRRYAYPFHRRTE